MDRAAERLNFVKPPTDQEEVVSTTSSYKVDAVVMGKTEVLEIILECDKK